MKKRNMTIALTVATIGIALGLALTGCASAAPTNSAAASHSPGAGDPTTAPRATTKACELVTAAMIKKAFGYDPGAASESPGANEAGSTECDFDGTGLIYVQLTEQADTYLPVGTYDKSQVDGGVDIAKSAGADRGYVAPEAVVLVKGNVGVFVTTGQDPGIPAGQALAKAIVRALG